MLMNCKVVTDSSADMLSLDKLPFASVPMKITAGEQTWVDDANADVAGMLRMLREHKGKSSSACPAPDEWREAFGDAQYVFCVTITSGLSGSYNSACVAAREYEEEFPGRRVLVVDSLSAGPELKLIVEKLEELCDSCDDFDTVAKEITAYQKRTHLTFALQSLRNFVNNGRVSPAVGALVGLLGIRIVGVASEVGQLQPTAKCRSDRKAIAELVATMKARGFAGGKALIDHCNNEALAGQLRDAIKAAWADAKITISTTRALCSYYAEEGGVLLGFESV